MRTFYLLDGLRHTADGADGIPSWFLKQAAPVYVAILADLINLSLSHSHVPEQWKIAVIKPVPKVAQPKTPVDFRPISVVPVLSRMTERELVHNYIYPSFFSPSTSALLEDQYAFRPTGSTTAALISILQQVTDLLTTNDYVTLISLDFSKAFDSVRH